MFLGCFRCAPNVFQIATLSSISDSQLNWVSAIHQPTLFLLVADLTSKNFFYKMFPTVTKESKTGFDPNIFVSQNFRAQIFRGDSLSRSHVFPHSLSQSLSHWRFFKFDNSLHSVPDSLYRSYFVHHSCSYLYISVSCELNHDTW